jgi:hypothetical protein
MRLYVYMRDGVYALCHAAAPCCHAVLEDTTPPVLTLLGTGDLIVLSSGQIVSACRLLPAVPAACSCCLPPVARALQLVPLTLDPWPKQAMVDSVLLLASWSDPGVTGAC